MTRGARSFVVLALVAAAAVPAGCSIRQEKPPEENPLLADMVDYRHGLQLLREGRVDEAISLLARSRQSHPTDAAVPNALGLALLYKKDYKGALKAFDESLKLDPLLQEAKNNRGVCYLEMGKLDEASRDFQAVLDNGAGGEKKNALFNMGLVYKRRGDLLSAERHFSLALNEDPQARNARRERGLIRMKREEFREALNDFLAVVKEDPNDAVATYNAALCLLTTGRRDVAAAYMERAATLAPESDEGRKAKRFLESEKEARPKGDVAP